MKISLENIKEGMCVGQDLYTESGQLITPNDTVLTSDLIQKLKRFRIRTVEIQNKSILKNEFISNMQDLPNFVSTLKGHKEFEVFQDKFQEATKRLNSSFDGILQKAGGISQISIIKGLSSVLYETNKNNLNLMDMIYNMQEHSDTVYTHCVNVGLIAGHLGRWLNFPEDEIKLLITCGLFHDIGKLLIPKEILEKPGKLTDVEYKIAQTHAQKGFDLLEQFDSIDERIKRAALLHHERCDGTGYPLNLKGKNLDKFSKIIAIADTYEAMTSDRCYRDSICPFTVAAYFENEGLHKFDTGYTLKFMDMMLLSYLHTDVMLSNNQAATVILINKNTKSRPLVALVDGTFLDLGKTTEINIVEMIN